MVTNKTPWLVELATVQLELTEAGARYDDQEQLTLRGPNQRLIDNAGRVVTKKADRETGEDQKAHW